MKKLSIKKNYFILISLFFLLGCSLGISPVAGQRNSWLCSSDYSGEISAVTSIDQYSIKDVENDNQEMTNGNIATFYRYTYEDDDDNLVSSNHIILSLTDGYILQLSIYLSPDMVDDLSVGEAYDNLSGTIQLYSTTSTFSNDALIDCLSDVENLQLISSYCDGLTFEKKTYFSSGTSQIIKQDDNYLEVSFYLGYVNWYGLNSAVVTYKQIAGVLQVSTSEISVSVDYPVYQQIMDYVEIYCAADDVDDCSHTACPAGYGYSNDSLSYFCDDDKCRKDCSKFTVVDENNSIVSVSDSRYDFDVDAACVPDTENHISVNKI